MKNLILGAAVLALLLAIPAAAGPDNLSEARKLMDRGMYWTAAEKLTAMTEENPKNPEAWALLARCHLRGSNPDAAETAAAEAVYLDEESAESWFLWGEAFFERGVGARAAGLASSAIKSLFADSEMKFKQALKLNPDHPQVRWWLAWAKEWQEYPEEARKLYEEQIAKHPKVIAGYRRLGQLIANEANNIAGGLSAEAQAHRQKALELFEKGLKVAGDDAETLYYYGFALEWAKKGDEAKKAYLRAAEADPDYHKAWTRLNELGVGSDVLLPLATKLLKKHKNAVTPATWAGYLIMQRSGEAAKGKYEAALAILLPALVEHGDSVGLYTQCSAAAGGILKSNPVAAVEALKKIHEAYAWSADASNNLGLFYRDSGQYDLSLEWYLKSAERAPESQDILNDTGLIYLFHGTGEDRKKSLPYFEKILSLVLEEERAPERGYWDTLENLCMYYWEVDRQPLKVIEYADMRYVTTLGVEPYNRSGRSLHFKKLAEKALGR